VSQEDEGRPHGAPHHNLTDTNSTAPGRQRPALLLSLELEAYGRARVQAETAEDHRRLVLWLARSDAIPRLHLWLDGISEWLQDEAA